MAVKFGVIGVGGFSFNRSLPAFLNADHFELAAIMDAVSENVKNASEKFSVPENKCYHNVDDLLADPDVEAVMISTPVHTHAALALKAIESGKHVFSEKPLGRTTAEAEKVVAAADKNRIKLGVGFHLRFHVLHQKAKELIDDGSFGNVNLIRMQNHLNYPEIVGAWRQNPEMSGGGGPSIDVGSHHIDLMCYLTGSPVKEITAVAANQVHKYKVEDISLILLRFENGTLGMMDLSWNIPHRFNVFEVYGSKASLYCEKTVGPFRDPYARLLTGDKIEELTPEYQDTYTIEAEAFARWIEYDEPFLIQGTEGIVNNRLLEKVNEAILTKKTIVV
ncbi:hypothetical protein GF337_18325 [candidate division KSB1 bacterium]|nr:hypothetical protein [candidate division KSB1 bacterium]